MQNDRLFKAPPIAGLRLSELAKGRPISILAAMKIAAADAKTCLAGRNKMTYIYADNSKLTVCLDGTCYIHTGWIKDRFLDDEDTEIMSLCLR